MTTVNDIAAFLEGLAPRDLAESWDNVGLLCGSRKAGASRVLVALDPFEEVAAEAAQWGADLLLTHHPLIFSPLRSLDLDTSQGRTLALLLQKGIAALCAHTNLDCAPGGVNDTLAAALGLSDIAPIPGQQLLRMGTVPELPLDTFLVGLRSALVVPGLRFVRGRKPVSRVAVGGGACAGALEEAVRAGCDTFVTADVKYNQFRDAFDLGLNLIDAGHFYTENPVCPVLAEKLQAAFPELTVKISEKARDPMEFA